MTTTDAPDAVGSEKTSAAIASQLEAQAASAKRLDEVIAGAEARVGAAEARLSNLLADQALGQELPKGEPQEAERDLERARLTLKGLEADRARSAEVRQVLDARQREAAAAELQAEQEGLAVRWTEQASALMTAAVVLVAAGRECLSLLAVVDVLAHRRAELAEEPHGSRHYKRLWTKLNRPFEERELWRIRDVAPGYELVTPPALPEGDAA
jgi:hypothetical protein